MNENIHLDLIELHKRGGACARSRWSGEGSRKRLYSTGIGGEYNRCFMGRAVLLV